MTLSPPLQQVDRTFVLNQGRKLSYFGGCDYFRLSSHPQVLQAAEGGLRRYGLNVSASRITTGNHQLYENLEKQIARFFGAPSATLASNGYVPNLMVAQALAGQFSHALIDERAHGCLADAAQLLDCPIVKFRNQDAADLARILKRLGNIRPIILTDGMFSHDGTLAPIKQYLAALPAGGMILLDDAHGAGTLGKTGRGTLELAGVPGTRIIQTITLSKAFGVYGGAVLSSPELRSAIISKSRLFSGNTPLPLPLANAALKSLAILAADKKMRARLQRNISFVKDSLCRAGYPMVDSPAPIIAIVPTSAKETARLKKRLLAASVFPSFIKYPGGPENGYFRFAISSEHTHKQLRMLINALNGTH